MFITLSIITKIYIDLLICKSIFIYYIIVFFLQYHQSPYPTRPPHPHALTSPFNPHSTPLYNTGNEIAPNMNRILPIFIENLRVEKTAEMKIKFFSILSGVIANGHLGSADTGQYCAGTPRGV